MPLKKAQGNMYDWVTHTHSHLAGKCPHECSYCYVQKMCRTDKYKGEPRLIESEFFEFYGNGKIIFIEHMNDLFAKGINPEWTERILTHCRKLHYNKFVFQTKDVARLLDYYTRGRFPHEAMIGTTIETNRTTKNISKAPEPIERYKYIKCLREMDCPVFVTLEPIMDFDNAELSKWILDIKPEFVNIGADSKRCNLPEPPRWKISNLIETLKVNHIQIKKKSNLERLMK